MRAFLRVRRIGIPLLLLAAWFGCSDNALNEDEVDFYTLLHGTWRVSSGGEDIRYLIFRPVRTWVILGEDSFGYRGTQQGTYVADEFFVDFGGSRFRYLLAGGQLTLLNSADTIQMSLEAAAPTDTTWVAQLIPVDSIVAPVNQSGDIAAESTYIWQGSGISPSPALHRLNLTTRTSATISTVTQPIAVEHDGTNLWTTGFFSQEISKLDPATGAVLTTSIPIASSILGLAWSGTRIWCSSSSSKQTYVYNPLTDAVETSFNGVYGDGMAFAGPTLFMCKNGLLHRCVTSSMRAAATYRLAPGSIQGVAWDGVDLWVLATTGQSPAFVHKLFKVRLPS